MPLPGLSFASDSWQVLLAQSQNTTHKAHCLEWISIHLAALRICRIPSAVNFPTVSPQIALREGHFQAAGHFSVTSRPCPVNGPEYRSEKSPSRCSPVLILNSRAHAVCTDLLRLPDTARTWTAYARYEAPSVPIRRAAPCISESTDQSIVDVVLLEHFRPRNLRRRDFLTSAV